MHSIPILAVAEKAHVSIMDALPYTVGALIVIATLAVLWGVCVLNARLVRLLAPDSTKNPAPAPLTASRPSPTADGIAPEIVAVVAAAVATASGKSHRIVSIKHQSTGWEKAGRQSVLTSHRIR